MATIVALCHKGPISSGGLKGRLQAGLPAARKSHGAMRYYFRVKDTFGRKDNMKLRTLPVFLAFLAMGFGDAVGPFVSLAKNEFQLSNAVASLIPFVGFSMFGLLSIPVGLVQDQLGKKFVLLLGLTVALVGLLNATFAVTSFAGFLLTIL